MTAAAVRGRPVRRVRAVTQTGQPHRVHLQVGDLEQGWALACPSRTASLAVVDDDDPAVVSCRQCANSGLAPSRWLPGTLDGGAPRGIGSAWWTVSTWDHRAHAVPDPDDGPPRVLLASCGLAIPADAGLGEGPRAQLCEQCCSMVNPPPFRNSGP